LQVKKCVYCEKEIKVRRVCNTCVFLIEKLEKRMTVEKFRSLVKDMLRTIKANPEIVTLTNGDKSEIS
jgi:hypothetical protein